MRASALQTDPNAEDGNRSSKSQGSTEGNGLLEPCEGKPSSTVLRGGGGGDAAPLPDTSVGYSRSRTSSGFLNPRSLSPHRRQGSPSRFFGSMPRTSPTMPFSTFRKR
jgi:hypothetical protein